MSELGKLTDHLEHKLQNLIDNLSESTTPVWRACRDLSTAALEELARVLMAELQRRKEKDDDHH